MLAGPDTCKRKQLLSSSFLSFYLNERLVVQIFVEVRLFLMGVDKYKFRYKGDRQIVLCCSSLYVTILFYCCTLMAHLIGPIRHGIVWGSDSPVGAPLECLG